MDSDDELRHSTTHKQEEVIEGENTNKPSIPHPSHHSSDVTKSIAHTKVWWKDPYTITLVVIILFTLFVRTKFMFQDSLWVDETHYMLHGAKLLENPLGVFSYPLSNNVQFPAIITSIFAIVFSPFDAGRLMGLFFVLVGIIVTYLIGKELGYGEAGLFAALLVAVNPLHWFIGSRALVDVPVATMITVFIYALILQNRQPSRKHMALLAFATLAAATTKNTGLVVFPILVVYYVYTLFVVPIIDPKGATMSLKDILKSKWLYLSVGLLALLVYNYSIVAFVDTIKNFSYRKDYIDSLPFIVGGNTIPSLITLVGIIVAAHLFIAVYMKKHDQIILPISFIIFLGVFSFLEGQNNPRYLLPLLTPLYTMAGIVLIEITVFVAELMNVARTKHTRYAQLGAIIIALLLVVPSLYAAGNALLIDKYYTYTGYAEAGVWLAENIEDDAVVYTMSTSWAGVFAGMETHNYGGALNNAAELKTPEMLAVRLNETVRPVYIVYDVWESWAQPQWLTQQQGLLGEMGFSVVHIVEKPVAQGEAKQKVLSELTFFGTVPRDVPNAQVVAIFKRGRQ